MRKTLAALLFTTLGISAGCQNLTPEGRAILYDFGIYTLKEAISGKVNPRQTNINVYNNEPQQRKMYENVVFNENRYYPAPGYKWINPDDQNDLRVTRIETAQSSDSSLPPAEILVCNRWEDKNKNGQFEIDEVIGRKDIFTEDEELTFFSGFREINCLEGKYTLRVFNSKNELVVQSSCPTIPEGTIFQTSIHEGLKPDKYIAEIYSNSQKKLASYEFRVISK